MNTIAQLGRIAARQMMKSAAPPLQGNEARSAYSPKNAPEYLSKNRDADSPQNLPRSRPYGHELTQLPPDQPQRQFPYPPSFVAARGRDLRTTRDTAVNPNNFTGGAPTLAQIEASDGTTPRTPLDFPNNPMDLFKRLNAGSGYGGYNWKRNDTRARAEAGLPPRQTQGLSDIPGNIWENMKRFNPFSG